MTRDWTKLIMDDTDVCPMPNWLKLNRMLTGETMAAVNSAAQSRQSSGAGSDSRITRTFSLEVISGTTQHRRRPLPQGRLSIGSGKSCWLQLGGRNMPEIHSWMEVTRDQVALYIFQESPTVQVNGAVVQFAPLRGGESIQIGPFEFILHAEEETAPSRHFNKPHFSSAQFLKLQDELKDSTEKLSASELVDLLEDEMRTVERHDARERSGMQQLLAAVAETQTDLDEENARTAAADAAQWQRCLEQMEQISASLAERSAALEARETEQSASAAQLLQMQQKMVAQMDQLISSLEAKEEEPQRKASA